MNKCAKKVKWRNAEAVYGMTEDKSRDVHVTKQNCMSLRLKDFLPTKSKKDEF